MRDNNSPSAGLYTFGRPSMPSGLWIEPKPISIFPGESAAMSVASKIESTLNHTNHLQRALGNRPLGNSRTNSPLRPSWGANSQEHTQAAASPAGSDPGSAKSP